MRERSLTRGARLSALRAFRTLTIFLAALAIAALAPRPARAWTYKVIYSFCTHHDCDDGRTPSGGLVADTSGNIFGTTADGGYRDRGTVFQISFDTNNGKWKERVLYNFCADCGDGSPGSGLVIDTSGRLYGITAQGGAGFAGTVFRLTPHSRNKPWTREILYSFCSTDSTCGDGQFPWGDLTYVGAETGTPYDGVSTLYGVTQDGGKHHNGVIYSLLPDGKKWKQRVVHALCGAKACNDGTEPGNVVSDAAGNLFVTTRSTSKLPGTILKFVPNGKEWGEQILYRFCAQANCTDGKSPQKVIVESSGNLIGTTARGGLCDLCGVAFSLTPDGTQSVIHNFCSLTDCADGNVPGPLLRDASGNLFGYTFDGGESGAGTAFELTSGGAFQTIYSFCQERRCKDGFEPYGLLMSDGNLFGVTNSGGEKQVGTVFELSP